MKSRGAALISLTMLLVFCCGTAAAVPPKGRQERRRNLQGLLHIEGVMVKSDEAGQWITVVAIRFSGGVQQEMGDRLEVLTPFRVACGKPWVEYGLGHEMMIICHVSEPPEARGGSGMEELVGVAAVPQFGEKVTSSGEADFDAMEKILKEALSDEARLLTVEALITIPGKRSSRTLAIAMFDIVDTIRLKVARELVARQYKPAVEKFAALLTRDIEDELGYQMELAEIMAGAGHAVGVEFLVRHLEDDNRGVVLAALSALANTGGAEEAAKLREFADASDDEELAAAAREAAEEIGKRVAE